MNTRILASLAMVAVLTSCSDAAETDPETQAQAEVSAGAGIETAEAVEASNVPLGSVPGVVTLPPEARVAVTAPFPGAAIRVYVIEGQAVRRGQPLALVRSAQPVQIRGDLSRAESDVGLAEARAKRLNQLAEEGIIAQARADEAKAALDQAQAGLTEQRRLAALGGVGPDGTMTLSAPISGRVAHVGVATGGSVDGMEAPFVIEAAGAYQVELQLPEKLANSVRPGMAIEVALSAGAEDAGPVGGQILTVSPSIDPVTRSVLARASVGGAPGVVAGRNVSVTIQGSVEQGGVAVPANAVTKIGGEEHVFVRSDDGFAPRKVTVVALSTNTAVISHGIQAGDIVAESGIAELKVMNAE